MKELQGWKQACAISLFCVATAITLPAQIFTSLGEFDGKHGADPEVNALVQGIDGSLYGTTISGGTGACLYSTGCGTVFKLNAGKLVPAYNFSCASQTDCSSSAFPLGSLALYVDGSFYGVAGGAASFATNRVAAERSTKSLPAAP